MSTVWICQNCHLTNSVQNKYCQACFNQKPTNIPFNIDTIQTENEPEEELNIHNTESLSGGEDISIEYATHTLSLSESEMNANDSLILPTTTLLGATNATNKFDSKSNINPEILCKLHYKQRILFDGFIRFSSVYDTIFIPSDVLNMTFAFLELNITKICSNIHKERTAIYSIQMKIDSTENENGNDSNNISYDDLYELAMILRGQRDCFIAYELMNELISIKPNLSEYENAMGLILKRWGGENCFDAAEIHYKKAILCEPNENIYRWNYGLLLEERLKYDLALEQFLNASKNVDEKEPDYIFESAYCYQKLNNFNNATINYLKAIEMDSNKSTYWIYYAEYLCEELKQYNEMKKHINCWIKLFNVVPQICPFKNI